MILLRDVTDVRRLDRLLLSKDAAIREVHHRVKNNLQTISSLLSLQARRVGDRAARVALHEAERRVRSIALVHEILSRDPSDQVPFAEIVSSLVQMAEDSVVSSQPIVISVHGDLGEVAADVATPLAVTVAELLQNAVEHAFDPENAGGHDGAAGLEGAGGGAGYAPVGHVDLTLSNEESALRVEVRDDGLGLPEGFDIERTTSLGLSIVRDLVVSQLEGTISMEPVPAADGGGTRVAISVPVRRPGERRPVVRRRCAALRWRRAASGGRPARPCAACGAPPRRCRPRRRTPGWWPARSRGRARCASQAWQTRLAASIWSTAGPVVPTGKKRSGSVLRQAADRRQSSASQSTVRFHMRAIGMCLHQHCDPFHMIGPSRCPSVKSGLTAKRVTVRREPGKEFFVNIPAALATES